MRPISSAKRRRAIQYVLAALLAFVGSGALLKAGGAMPWAAPGGAPGPGLLSSVVAALLAITGGLLLALAGAELFRAGDRSTTSAEDGKHMRGDQP